MGKYAVVKLLRDVLYHTLSTHDDYDAAILTARLAGGEVVLHGTGERLWPSSGFDYCGCCHTCGTKMKRVLDGEEWCPKCGVYHRYRTHGWGYGGDSEDSPCLPF